ncbi:hypothetical protein DCC39_07360 [Pueribacillus theae]|uniref:Glycine transporter domain-containing protein n=1 Tax=Pueribacillus theae TaxID=2171751 RepID=A0A2U1K400_9BACI|nr:trimeric intracellular cation channel family protein [Pueribacillus theae]PWA12241.1 hypothetical protein DCC39_07360 [Pueribacillus theae]
MVWDVLNVIGTIAFAISGAIIAMEEEYDILGVYILGFATAFGGGTVRNILIDLPLSHIWQQNILFYIAILVIGIVFFLPNSWIESYSKWAWGVFFDAIGLGAFAIQGALYAYNMNHPLIAVVVAAALTGAGGGVIRDLLARRQPLILKKEMYAVWAMMGGLIVGLGLANHDILLYFVLALIVACRMLAHHYGWQLPRKKRKGEESSA